jgi:hypothetical protein
MLVRIGAAHPLMTIGCLATLFSTDTLIAFLIAGILFTLRRSATRTEESEPGRKATHLNSFSCVEARQANRAASAWLRADIGVGSLDGKALICFSLLATQALFAQIAESVFPPVQGCTDLDSKVIPRPDTSSLFRLAAITGVMTFAGASELPSEFDTMLPANLDAVDGKSFQVDVLWFAFSAERLLEGNLTLLPVGNAESVRAESIWANLFRTSLTMDVFDAASEAAGELIPAVGVFDARPFPSAPISGQERVAAAYTCHHNADEQRKNRASMPHLTTSRRW